MFKKKKTTCYHSSAYLPTATTSVPHETSSLLALPQKCDSEYSRIIMGEGDSPKVFDGSGDGSRVEQSDLHQAIVLGDVEQVKILLERRLLGDLNLLACCCFQDDFGELNGINSGMMTPLCCAVQSSAENAVHVAQLLVDCGADVNLCCGPNKSTPLHLASSRQGNSSCVQFLLNNGASKDTQDLKGQTALHIAAGTSNPDCVAVLLSFGANPNLVDHTGRSPLHCAVSASSSKTTVECVRLLLVDENVDVDAQDIQGYTALHLSAGNVNSKCASLLLRHGCDATLKTSAGITALSMLARNRPDVITHLVDRLNSAVTLHECDASDPNCQVKMNFGALLPKNGKINPLQPLNNQKDNDDDVDKPKAKKDSRTQPLRRHRKETELLTCLVSTGNKKLLAHPLSEAFLLLKWRLVRKFFLASLLFQMALVALFTVFVVEVYLIRCPYTRQKTGDPDTTTTVAPLAFTTLNVPTPAHNISKRHANPYPYARAAPFPDGGFNWFRVVPAKQNRNNNLPPNEHPRLPSQTHALHPTTPSSSRAFGPASSPVNFNRIAGGSSSAGNFPNESELPAPGSDVVGGNENEESSIGSTYIYGGNIHDQIYSSTLPPEEEEEAKCSLNLPLHVIWLLLVTSISLMALQEIFQLVHSPSRYIVSSENWAQWLLIASVTITAWRSWDSEEEERFILEYWQYPAAACGILIAWSLILFQVGRFPSLGLYVEMLGKVAANFGLFILAYACLLIAFALAFCVLFPEHPPFSSVPLSILKVFTMMVGEVDYEDLFYSEERSHDPILFPLTAHLLFFAFVLIMTIVLMNLLVGLAVNDIQGLQRGAKLDRLCRQTALIARFESFIFSKKLETILPASLIRIIREKSLLSFNSTREMGCNDEGHDVIKSNSCSFYFRPNDSHDRSLPKDIKQAALNLLASTSPSINFKKEASLLKQGKRMAIRRSLSTASHLQHHFRNNRSESNNSNKSSSSSSHYFENNKSLHQTMDQRLSHVETKLENLEKGIQSILELLKNASVK